MLNANYPTYSPISYTMKSLYVECVHSCEGVIKGMYIVTCNVVMHA